MAVRSISTGDVSHCLNAGGMGRIDYETETVVVEPYTLAIRGREGGATLEARQDGVSNAILTPTGGRAGAGVGAVAHNLQVRRLTPTEAERLMGFPDGHTLIPYRGKPAADGPRYKSLGNSMAIPVVSWIGRQIEIAESNVL